MKQIVYSGLVLSFLIFASPASAQCYADYKAKRDNPMRLHYGVIQLQGDCSQGAATAEVARRIAQGGWTLLNVVSVFGPEGLEERRESAGLYFLWF